MCGSACRWDKDMKMAGSRCLKGDVFYPIQVANLGADSGEEWVDLFKAYNSGTYNNQWMILDVNLLLKHAKAGVLEQILGISGPTSDLQPPTSHAHRRGCCGSWSSSQGPQSRPTRPRRSYVKGTGPRSMSRECPMKPLGSTLGPLSL